MKSRYYYFFFYILVSRTTLAYLYFFFFNWLIHNSLNLPLLIFILQSLKTHLIEAAQRYFSMLSLDHVEILSQSFHPRSRKLRVPNTFYKFYEHYSSRHYIFGQCNDNFDRSCNQIRLDFSFFISHVYFTIIL